MGSLSAARKRLLGVLALSGLVIAALVTLASAAGPGGWDHVGSGATPGSVSLNSPPRRWR